MAFGSYTGYASWIFYQKGVPGTPELAGVTEYNGVGGANLAPGRNYPESRSGLNIPKWGPPSEDDKHVPSIKAYYQDAPPGTQLSLNYGFNRDNPVSELNIQVPASETETWIAIYFRGTTVKQLENGFGISDIAEGSNESPTLIYQDISSWGGESLALIGLSPGKDTAGRNIIIPMSATGTVAKENARIILSSMKLENPAWCQNQELSNGRRTDAIMRFSKDAPTRGNVCSPLTGHLAPQRITATPLAYPNIRLDSADPAPVSDGKTEWESANELTVKASYVLLDEESQGQTYIFFSGVGAGLATAIVPIGFQIVTTAIRKRKA